MAKIKVCALFRPLNSKERDDHGESVCIQRIDSESFIFKDEKAEELEFSFDRVFYPGSEQADVYEFLALPIVQGAINGLHGAIITYGQTGAGKTYSMEGSGIMGGGAKKKGLLPRVIDGLFDAIKLSNGMTNYVIKLSMVDIYMERIRDLFDLSKDNIQIKESKLQGIKLSGVTEINITNSAEALQSLCNGIANRAVGETQMNMASSRSHCLYMFTVQHELAKDKRVRSGKLMLVDLAGCEKVEKTGAEGIVLEEAKSINKSLSALGNVISALTSSPGKANHIPYRDSKLTRVLQDSLGGNSQTGLLCCCSPSPSNILESLSTLRFGARAKHIKAFVNVPCPEDLCSKKNDFQYLNIDETRERILVKLRDNLKAEDVKLLQELFTVEGIFFNPNSVEEVQFAYEDMTSSTILSLQKAVEELSINVKELKRENAHLKARLAIAERSNELRKGAEASTSFLSMIPGSTLLGSWIGSYFPLVKSNITGN